MSKILPTNGYLTEVYKILSDIVIVINSIAHKYSILSNIYYILDFFNNILFNILFRSSLYD